MNVLYKVLDLRSDYYFSLWFILLYACFYYLRLDSCCDDKKDNVAEEIGMNEKGK